MEGAPKFEAENNEENLSEWRELKAEAPEKAEELISGIEGFDEMSAEEQMDTLQTCIDRLAEEGNHHRFVASEVARIRAVIEEENRHEREMARLRAA